MIQIYKKGNEDFTRNGDATITPISCTSEMTLGGSWELELEAPIDELGKFDTIQAGAVISVPSPWGNAQLWRIYDRDKGDESVTAKARPIFLDAARDVFLIDCRPTKMAGQAALDWMMRGTKYKGQTDITKVNTSYYVRKNLIQAIAGDDENSFVNRWGGEILYDNYTISVMSQQGKDRGLRVEFGRNIESIHETENTENLATRLVPVSYNGYMLPGDTPWVDSPRINDYPIVHVKVLECKDIKLRADLEASGESAGDEDEDNGDIIVDTLVELQRLMRERCEETFATGADLPTLTYDVDMIDLSGKAEYAEFKELEKALLADTVHCNHRRLKIVNKAARIIKVRFDHIKQINLSLTIGDFNDDYFDRVRGLDSRVSQAEDTLHNLQTSFTVLDGKIEGKIWQEDIDIAVDGLSAEVDEKFSDVTQTVDEIHTSVGEIKSTQDEQGRQIEQYRSDFTQTATELQTEVSKKVGNDEIISRINQSAEQIKIQANKIVFEGLVTANQNFQIKTDGSIVAKNAEISGNISIAGNWGGIKQGEGMTVYADGTTETTSGIMMYGSNGPERAPFIMVTNKGARLQGGDDTQLYVSNGRIGFNNWLIASNNVSIGWITSAGGTQAYGFLRFTSADQFVVGHSNYPTYIYGSNIYFNGNVSGAFKYTVLWEGSINTNTTVSWSDHGSFVFYIVQGRPGASSSSFVCATIPGYMVFSGTSNQWQIADDASFTSFILTPTSLQRVGGSGYLYRVFGIR